MTSVVLGKLIEKTCTTAIQGGPWEACFTFLSLWNYSV